MTEDGWPGRHGDLKFGGLRWPMSVVCRLSSGVWRGGVGNLKSEIRDEGAPEGWEVLTAEITEMEMGGRGTFFRRISRIFTDGRGAKDFYPQISQISTDGEKGCPLLSERSGNRYVAQNNLCESV